MSDLKNEVVLITGASSGTGAAAALSVVAQIQAAGSSARVFGCDVMDSVQFVQLVQAVHARFGRINVLINNVGGMKHRIALS